MSLNQVIIKSPTRVDLAGGTLDMWPLYSFLGGAVTVNVAVDIFSEVELTPNLNGNLEVESITIDSLDLNYHKTFKNRDDLLKSDDKELNFYKPLISFFNLEKGFKLKTKSQSPVGAGLGGSSSLLISCLKAFYKMTKCQMPSAHEMVYLAHNLEAQILTTPTGTQDYYPAISGGLNILTYHASGIEQKVISTEKTPLKKHFLLVHTGKSHHSGINNFEVLKAAVRKDKETLMTLSALKEVASEMALVCEKNRWSEIPRLFDLEYKFRIQLTSAFSSPEIIKLKEIVMKNGEQSIKICGAGGGGCVLIWTEESTRSSIVNECQKQGYQILNSQPVDLI